MTGLVDDGGSTLVNGRQISTKEYFELTKGKSNYHLVDSKLRTTTELSTEQQNIQLNLSKLLGSFLRQHALGSLFISPTPLKLDDKTIVRPALVAISGTNRHSSRYIDTIPELVVEFSTDTEHPLWKRNLYEHYGVPELWIIQSSSKQLFRYYLDDHQYNLDQIFEGRDNLFLVLGDKSLDISLNSIFE